MVTFLISSFLVLIVLALAVYLWQKPPASTEGDALLPPPERGLFIDGTPGGQAETLALAEADSAATAKTLRRTELLERARNGEKSTLQEAHNTEDAAFYEEALDFLIAGADSDPKLLSLVSYVARHDLRINKKLAEKAIDSYKRAPDRDSTAKMLHLAALSDDAAVFQDAVETALKFWRAGRLPEVSAPELRAVLEGEFWILSAPTRSSGAGFLLKRALADARRELEAAHNG
jgi:hypothetical protein